MRILVAIRVVPIGTCSTSISSYVAEVINILKEKGVKYSLTPFNTAMELTNLNQLSEILGEVVRRLSSRGVSRLAIDVQLDVRLDKEITLEYKVNSVLEKLQPST